MFIDDRISQRLGGRSFGRDTTEYKFGRIKRLKEMVRARRPDMPLIDLGVGEPDLPADQSIVEVLASEAGRPENRFYADNGIAQFQEAAAEYMERVYGVKSLHPGANIIHGIGSKPILAMLPLCLIDPGDITLMTVPGYPILATHTQYLGGSVYPVRLDQENGFYPDLTSIPSGILNRAKMLYINYPNNPTGQVPTTEFFEEVVDLAAKHGIVIVHDAAYGAIRYDGQNPLSIMAIDGAMDVAVEVHSLSKAFNMTGWRLGFIVGGREMISAYANVKDNVDSGQFRAIQLAGAHALNHPELTAANCERYARRIRLLTQTLREVGFDAREPRATFYLYVKSPTGARSAGKFSSADEAGSYILEHASICTVPWDDAGGYLRMSVTFPAESPEDELALMAEIKARLNSLQLSFN